MIKLPPVTEEQWAGVCDFNKSILSDFLDSSTEKSPKTLRAYESNLKIWFIWVKDNLNNKRQIDIKSIEFKRFQNWLVNRGCSSADCANKRSAISTLNNHIMIYYADEYPTFHNFINASIARPPKAFVHEKKPLTKEEVTNLIEELEQREEWQKIAYLKFTIETGCRRAESSQLMKTIVDSEPVVKKRIVEDEDGNEVEKTVKYYVTDPIRCKGRGSIGKVRKFKFGQDTMDALKKWIEERGDDDCPNMFITKYCGEIRPAGDSTFNGWCSGIFTSIVGRRVHPHLFRETRATQLVVEDGMDIKIAQQLLGHESSTTTEIYVIRDDSEDLDDLFI